MKEIFQIAFQSGLRVFNSRSATMVLLPISTFLAIILTLITPILNKFLNSRVYVFNISAIGHDVSDFIEFLQQLEFRSPSAQTRLLFRHNTQNPTNNLFLFEIWRRSLTSYKNVRLIESSAIVWCVILFTIRLHQLLDRPLENWLIPLTPNFSTFKSLTKQKINSLTNESDQKAIERLLDQTIGAPPGTYCVLGIRDSGFYGDQSIRNTPREHYIPAIEYLLELGTPVIRLGRKIKEPIKINHPLFFDYSYSDFVSDRNDILLWINAKFGVGDSSGIIGPVASFGSPLFMPTYPQSPREFLSNENVYFATQNLFRQNGQILTISEIVTLMNSIGDQTLSDERLLRSLDLESRPNSPIRIRESLIWFINVAIKKSTEEINITKATQNKLLNFLALNDQNTFTHYRKDALYSHNWQSMKSHIWPQSVEEITVNL